jgi:hypothetical protein
MWFMTWYTMRQAALMRHELLVNAMFPPGPKRDLEQALHIEFVKLVYGA